MTIALTALEKIVLTQGVIENPHYTESGWAWQNTVAIYSGLDSKIVRGVLTSLKSKGAVEDDGNVGVDACVRPTEEGLEAAKA
jgi:hypothetical protein